MKKYLYFIFALPPQCARLRVGVRACVCVVAGLVAGSYGGV